MKPVGKCTKHVFYQFGALFLKTRKLKWSQKVEIKYLEL